MKCQSSDRIVSRSCDCSLTQTLNFLIEPASRMAAILVSLNPCKFLGRNLDPSFKIPKALLPVKIYTVSHYDFNYNHAQ